MPVGTFGGPSEIHPALLAALLARGAGGATGAGAMQPTQPPSMPMMPSSGRIGTTAPTFGPGGAAAPASRGKMPNAPGPTATFGADGGGLLPPPIVDTSASAGSGGGAGGFKGGGMLTTSGTVPDRSGTAAGGGAGAGATKPKPTAGAGRTYGGYTAAQLAADPSLVARLGPHAAAAWAADQAAGGSGSGGGGTTGAPAPPPTAPPTAAPPAPLTPFVPAPGTPSTSGGAPGARPQPQNPWAGGGSFDPWVAFYGNAPQPYAFDDPFNQILSLLPVMDLNAKKQLASSMADAGFKGTRFGSAAMRKAAEVGSENSLQQNAMMNQVLGDAANRSQDRALQATGQGTNLGALIDAIRRGQINTLSDVGQMEQGRQDQFSNTAFGDWSQNRLGYLPLLLQAAMSRHSGSPGGTIAIPQPGQQSSLDRWGPIVAGLLGGLV